MAIDTFSVLMLFSVTIFLGYFGSLFFHKTRISDAFWLLVFGLMIGPVFHVVDPSPFTAALPLLSALAVIIILFDSGLNMEFYEVMREAPRSMLLAVLEILLTIVVVGYLSMALFKFTALQGMLLGAMLGGTCTSTIGSIVNKIRMSEDLKTVLGLSAILNGPMSLVLSIALINEIVATGTGSALSTIFAAFSIGGVIGLFLGIVWMAILDGIKGRPFDYMITLAVIFIMYVFVESIGGSGAIAALVFGLVLGNSDTFSRILKTQHMFTPDLLVKKFNVEASFFMNAFFFMYVGLAATINLSYIIYGMLITAWLVIARLIAVGISTIGMRLTKLEMNISNSLIPRELTVAVIAQLPAVYGIKGAEVYSNLAFIVIILSILYTTFATRVFYNPNKPAAPAVATPMKPAGIRPRK